MKWYLMFSYIFIFIIEVVAVSKGTVTQEEHGAALLFWLLVSPVSLPCLSLIGIGIGLVKLIFFLGGLL